MPAREFPVGWKSKKTIAEKKVKIGNVGFDKVRSEFEFIPKGLSDGLVIKAQVRGKGQVVGPKTGAGERSVTERRFVRAEAEGILASFCKAEERGGGGPDGRRPAGPDFREIRPGQGGGLGVKSDRDRRRRRNGLVGLGRLESISTKHFYLVERVITNNRR